MNCLRKENYALHDWWLSDIYFYCAKDDWPSLPFSPPFFLLIYPSASFSRQILTPNPSLSKIHMGGDWFDPYLFVWKLKFLFLCLLWSAVWIWSYEFGGARICSGKGCTCCCYLNFEEVSTSRLFFLPSIPVFFCLIFLNLVKSMSFC